MFQDYLTRIFPADYLQTDKYFSQAFAYDFQEFC